MLVFSLSSGDSYVFPHIVDMGRDIVLLRDKTGDKTIKSLINSLWAVLVTDGPAEILRLNELEKLIKVRKTIYGASVPQWTVDPIKPESASKKAFRESPSNQSNPEFGKVNSSRTGKQAYEASDIYVESSRKSARFSEFLVSRQEFYLRELNVGLAWIEARRDFINGAIAG